MASRHGVTYPPGLTCYPSARSVHVGWVAGIDHLADNQQTEIKRSIIGFLLGYVEALSFTDSDTHAT